MKYLYFALVFIANTLHAQDSVKISGNIQHPLTDGITISYNNNRIAYYPNEYYARIDKKGNFSIAFPVPNNVYTEVAIKHGSKYAEIILRAGDSLVLTANTDNFDSTIHYKGKGSGIQNFIARHTIDRGLMNTYSLRIKEVLHKDPVGFLKSIEQEKKAEIAFLNKYKSDLPQSFIKYWTAYYQYYNYFFIQQYPQVHEMLKLRRFTDTIPDVNYTVVKEMPYAFNDSLVQVMPYLLYLTGVFDIKLKAEGYSYFRDDTMKKRKLDDSVYTLAYKLLPDKSAEYFIAQNIYGRAKDQQPERTRTQFNRFRKKWPSSEYLPLLEQQVSTAERLAAGQPAPDIDITTPDGRTIKLSDLKGKVVYLGFWASWCKQCVGEMIAEQQIKTLTENQPLEFVYVSIDKDTTAASNIIKKYKISGLCTNVKDEWNAKELKLYGVQSLPSYFLVDKDGNFAVQNALTPAQPTQLMLQIGRLLK